MQKKRQILTKLIKENQVQNISINFTDCIYNKNSEIYGNLVITKE